MRTTHRLVYVLLAAYVGVMVMPCEARAAPRDHTNFGRVCFKNNGPGAIEVKKITFKNGAAIVGSATPNVRVAAGTKKSFTLKLTGTHNAISVETAAVASDRGTCVNDFDWPTCQTFTCVGRVIDISEPNGCVDCSVPTVSEWGLIAMILLVLTVGTVVLTMRRRLAAV
ncbi:MAG: hypothetical protein IH987_21630 [Planctomycetes bacterium]|nr:hypothetical protein [Planctomycetota bacterium]